MGCGASASAAADDPQQPADQTGKKYINGTSSAVSLPTADSSLQSGSSSTESSPSRILIGKKGPGRNILTPAVEALAGPGSAPAGHITPVEGATAAEVMTLDELLGKSVAKLGHVRAATLTNQSRASSLALPSCGSMVGLGSSHGAFDMSSSTNEVMLDASLLIDQPVNTGGRRQSVLSVSSSVGGRRRKGRVKNRRLSHAHDTPVSVVESVLAMSSRSSNSQATAEQGEDMWERLDELEDWLEDGALAGGAEAPDAGLSVEATLPPTELGSVFEKALCDFLNLSKSTEDLDVLPTAPKVQSFDARIRSWLRSIWCALQRQDHFGARGGFVRALHDFSPGSDKVPLTSEMLAVHESLHGSNDDRRGRRKKPMRDLNLDGMPDPSSRHGSTSDVRAHSRMSSVTSLSSNASRKTGHSGSPRHTPVSPRRLPRQRSRQARHEMQAEASGIDLSTL